MTARDTLIAVIKKNTDVSNTAANATLSALFEAIIKTTKKEGRLSLPGFGTFTVVKRAARNGFNPRTGQPIKIKARKTLRFKASVGLRDI